MKIKMDFIMIKDGTFIITENSDGMIYFIHSKCIQDILDDWNGDCNFVPANDARVFFASVNGIAINPYEYQDFESLLQFLVKLQNSLHI